MSLTDLMSRAQLHVWAEAALVMFVLIFLGVCAYAFSRGNRETFDRARRLPLDDVPDRRGRSGEPGP